MAEADLTAGEITHMQTASELYLHDTGVVRSYAPTTDSFGNPGPPTYVDGSTLPCRVSPAMQQEILADTDVPVLDQLIYFKLADASKLANTNNRFKVTKRWGSTLGTEEEYEIEGPGKRSFVLWALDVRKATN